MPFVMEDREYFRFIHIIWDRNPCTIKDGSKSYIFFYKNIDDEYSSYVGVFTFSKCYDEFKLVL